MLIVLYSYALSYCCVKRFYVKGVPACPALVRIIPGIDILVGITAVRKTNALHAVFSGINRSNSYAYLPTHRPRGLHNGLTGCSSPVRLVLHHIIQLKAVVRASANIVQYLITLLHADPADAAQYRQRGHFLHPTSIYKLLEWC